MIVGPVNCNTSSLGVWGMATKSDHSSFWTTGIWVLLRYLALPVMICCAIYFLGGPTNRTKINARAYAFVEPVVIFYGKLIGDSELAQSRVHFRDPDTTGAAVVKLGDLPVAAEVPVVNLDDLPALEGPSHVNLSDLPEPVEDTVVFLLTKPEVPLAIAISPRPRKRPEQEVLAEAMTVSPTEGAEPPTLSSVSGR